MNRNIKVDEGATRELTLRASAWMGFRPDAISPESIRQAVRSFLAAGLTVEGLQALRTACPFCQHAELCEFSGA